MKTLLITMVLAIACASPIVATEKRQQTNLQDKVISNNANNSTMPISVDAVYEFLQKEGYAVSFDTVEDIKYIELKYKDKLSCIVIEDDYVTFESGTGSVSKRIKSKYNLSELSDKEIAGIYKTCCDLSTLIKFVKVIYNPNSDTVLAHVEAFIPTMEMFKYYFPTYIGVILVTIESFDEYVYNNIELGMKN